MAEGQVSVPLPEGMTPEAFMKAFETFQKARVAGQVRDKATRGAMKELIDLHKVEYEKLLVKHSPK